MTRTNQLTSERALMETETPNPESDSQAAQNLRIREAMAFQEKFANAMASEEAWKNFIWENYDLYGKFFPPSREEIIKALNSGKPFREFFADPKVANNLAGFEEDCQKARQALTSAGVGSTQRRASPADFTTSVVGISTHGEPLVTVGDDVKTARQHVESVYFRSSEFQGYVKKYRQELNSTRRQLREDAKIKRQEIADVDAELAAKRRERDTLEADLRGMPEPFGQEYDDRQGRRTEERDKAESKIQELEAERQAKLAEINDERMRIMTSGKSGAELTRELSELYKETTAYEADYAKKIKAQRDRIAQLDRDADNDRKLQGESTVEEKSARLIAVNAEIQELDRDKQAKTDELDDLTRQDRELTELLSPASASRLIDQYNETHVDENNANIKVLLENAGLSDVADQRIILRDGGIYVLPPSLEAGDKISTDFLMTPEELASPLPPMLASSDMTTEEAQKEDEMFADFQNSIRADVEFDTRTRRQAARGQNFIYRNGKMRANYSGMSGTDAIVHSVYGLTRVGNKASDNKTLREIARLKATEFIMRGVDLGDPAKNQAICAGLQVEIQKRLMYLDPEKMRAGAYNDAINWVNDRSAEIAHKTLVEMGYDPALVPAAHAKNGFEYQARTTTGEIRFGELVNTPVRTIAPHTLSEETVNGIVKPKIAAVDAMNVSRILYLANMEGVPEAQARWESAITAENLDEAFRRDGCQKLAGLMNKQLRQLQPFVRKGRKGKKFNEKEKRVVSDAVGQLLAIIKNDPNNYILKQLDRDLIYDLVEVAPEELQETLRAIGNELGVPGMEAAADAPAVNGMATGVDQPPAPGGDNVPPEPPVDGGTPAEGDGSVYQPSMFDPDVALIRDGELGSGELTDIVVTDNPVADDDGQAPGPKKPYSSPKVETTDGGEGLESEERNVDAQKVLKPPVEPILNRVKEIMATEPKDAKEAKAFAKEISKLQGEYNDTMRDWKQHVDKTKKQNPDAHVMEGTELNDEIHLPADKLFAEAKRQQKQRVGAATSANSGASV